MLKKVNIALASAVVALVGCVSGGKVDGTSPCLSPESAARVAQTARMVVHAVDLDISAPYDALRGARYACVLLEFRVSPAGKAEDPVVIHSVPTWALERAAFRALRGYLFEASSNSRSGMLLFEFEISGEQM